MTPSKIKSMLWRLGHFSNPAHPAGIKESDLDGLTLTDDAVRIAIQSYQEFMASDFDRLSLEKHDRIGIADGQVGPATKELFQVPRCGCADYSADMATGGGSWPAGCHEEWPDNHAFAVYFDFRSMPSHWGNPDDPDSVFRQAWEKTRLVYADIGIVFFETKERSEANTVVSWQRGSSWIGLAIVPNSPRCGETIWAKFDNRYNPSDLIDLISWLLTHEFGHNMSLGHSRGGIMNPTVPNGQIVFTPTMWRGDPSEPKLTRYFGGEPVDLDPGDPDPPPPPPPNGQLIFRGEFEAFIAGSSYGKFILTPKPEV